MTSGRRPRLRRRRPHLGDVGPVGAGRELDGVEAGVRRRRSAIHAGFSVVTTADRQRVAGRGGELAGARRRHLTRALG